MEELKFIGHRGNQALSAENSYMAIMDCSNALFIDGSEIDIRPSKDNKIMISHNPYIYNENNKKMIIQETTSDDLINKGHFEVSPKDKFEQIIMGLITKDKYYLKRYRKLHTLKTPICDLESILNAFDEDKELLIEIKMELEEYSNEMKNIFINNLIELLDKYDKKTFTIESFNLNILDEIKEKRENTNIVALYNRNSKLQDISKNFDGYALEYPLVNEVLIEKLMDNRQKLYTWDNKMIASHMKKVKEIYKEYEKEILIGLLDYAVISDYPERMRKKILSHKEHIII